MDESSTSSSSRSSSPVKWGLAAQFHNRLGVDPKRLVGKVLRRSKRSSAHPTLTLEFADNTSFQLRVDGYDPRHKGLPKLLSIDDASNSPIEHLPNSSILDCVLITLSDKAFRRDTNAHSPTEADWWDQDHTVLALKFDQGSWHTVSVRMQDVDPNGGECMFRSYSNVYLEQLSSSPRKKRRTSHI